VACVGEWQSVKVSRFLTVAQATDVILKVDTPGPRAFLPHHPLETESWKVRAQHGHSME